MTDTAKIERLAQALQQLRAGGSRAATESFGDLPSYEEALAVSGRVQLDGPVADAFKVARSPEGFALAARLHPFVAPGEGNNLVFHEGTLIEVEIAVQLAQDIPVREDGSYDRPDILALVEKAFLGIELVRSAVLEGGKVCFPLFLADRLGNDGYLLGPEVPMSLIDSVNGTHLTIDHGATRIWDAPAQHANGDVIGWLVDYANRKDRPADSLKKGALVTTGSLCGGIPLSAPGPVKVALSGVPQLAFAVL